MFTLEDGREHLYQWDLNRRILVNDPTICEVHFCNRTSDCSLVVEVIDGIADIPNILLQEARPIRAYAYCDDQYTLTETQFTVKARTRPEDYVYEETETLQYSTLDKKITELEENIPAIVAEEVEQYMEENPDVDLSDYYTKEETDTAIYNSKDAYYLDFHNATEANQPATADMIEFVTRFDEGQNVCAHIRAPQNIVNAIRGWQPATVQKIVNSYVFTANAINPQQIEEGYVTPYYSFEVKNDSTAGWVYYTKYKYTFAIATTDYVEQAIADSATGDIELTNYYTKEETDTAIHNSKDAYYINFINATTEEQDATEEMIAFAERWKEGHHNICVHIMEAPTFGNTVGWQTAVISGVTTNITLTGANINAAKTLENKQVRYVEYKLVYKNDKWVYFANSIYEFTLATTDYVTQAINDAFSDIAIAEEGSY